MNEGVFAVPGLQSSGDPKSFTHALLVALAKEYNFSMDVPYKDLPQEAKDVIMYGTGRHSISIHYRAHVLPRMCSLILLKVFCRIWKTDIV